MAMNDRFLRDKFGYKNLAVLDNSATGVTWNPAKYPIAYLLLDGNKTISTTPEPVDGDVCILLVQQDGTGSRTLSYTAANFDWGSDGAPTLSTTTGVYDIITFVGFSGDLAGSSIKTGYAT
jgi:hypothetical protein